MTTFAELEVGDYFGFDPADLRVPYRWTLAVWHKIMPGENPLNKKLHCNAKATALAIPDGDGKYVWANSDYKVVRR